MISEVSHFNAVQILSRIPVLTVSFLASFVIVAEDIPVNLCRSVLLRPFVNQQFPELFVAYNHVNHTSWTFIFLNTMCYIKFAIAKQEVIFRFLMIINDVFSKTMCRILQSLFSLNAFNRFRGLLANAAQQKIGNITKRPQRPQFRANENMMFLKY